MKTLVVQRTLVFAWNRIWLSVQLFWVHKEVIQWKGKKNLLIMKIRTKNRVNVDIKLSIDDLCGWSTSAWLRGRSSTLDRTWTCGLQVHTSDDSTMYPETTFIHQLSRAKSSPVCILCIKPTSLFGSNNDGALCTSLCWLEILHLSNEWID